MASPNNNVATDQYLTNLVGIRNELAQITDYWRDVAKENGTIGKEIGNILGDSQKLNKILSRNEDIESRIGTELVSQGKAVKFQKDIAGQLELAKTKLVNLEATIGAEHDKTVKSLEAERVIRDGIEKKQEALLNSGRKGKKYQEELSKLSMLRESQLEREAVLERNKSYIQIKLSQEQVRLAKEAVDNAKDLESRVVASNNKIKRSNFAAAILKRPLAILGIGEKQFESFKQFGMLGGGLTLAAMAAKKLVELMFAASQQVTDIQRGFNTSSKEAIGLRGYLKSASNILDGIDNTQQDILDAQIAIKEATGIATIYSKENLKTLAGIQSTISLSAEAIKGLSQYSNLSSKSFAEIRNTVLGTTVAMQLNGKVQLDTKKILEKVLSLSGDIRANFAGNVEELTKAVTKAQQYGTSLEDIDKTTNHLLDFESSISSQLEAELLTSKHINLERARAASLTNDMSTVMDEIVKQAGTFDQFNKLNRIQQQGLAQSLGMSRGELSEMLLKRKEINALAKLGNYDTQQSLADNYAKLKQMGVTSDQITKALGEQVAKNLEQQSAGERFTKVLTKLQEIVANLFDGDKLNDLVSGLAAFVSVASEKGFVRALLGGGTGEEQKRLKAKLNDNGTSLETPVNSLPSRKTTPTANNSSTATGDPGSTAATYVKSLLDETKKSNMLLQEIKEKNSSVNLDSRRLGTYFGLSYSSFA